MYTLDMLSKYGQDIKKETDEEVSLWLGTSAGSVAFFREMGSLLNDVINSPKSNESLGILLPISITSMFATLNEVSTSTRQAVTDDSLIDIYEPPEKEKQDGSKYVDIQYYRVYDMSTGNVWSGDKLSPFKFGLP